MRLGLVLILITLSGALASAKISVEAPLTVTTGVPSWESSFKKTVASLKQANTYPADGYTECRETVEIPNAFLCLYNTQRGMNSALARSSFYIEGTGGQKGVIPKQNDRSLESMKSKIGGHDLKGVDLLRFDHASTAACSAGGKDVNVCNNSYEEDVFINLIRPETQKSSKFVLITFASQSNMDWREVVTHEILHAQYFNDARFQEIADRFWDKDMTEPERESVRNALERYYDKSDELLMKNEFQAYMLMAGAEYNQLASFVPKYRARLLKYLSDAGIAPIQVK